MDPPKTPHLLNALADDNTSSHEEALLRIYQRLRPGNPPQLEKARALFNEKFFDANRYRLGRVGRFRINRKLGLNVSETEMVLRPEDLVASINYLLMLVAGESEAYVDDIDHLGNRRLRTIDELACDEIRKGFLKLRRTVQERMSLKDAADMTPRSLINPKSISAAIEYFFGRGELSQVVDQTNPLSMLTHERRLSALGPGGLNRKRAGFEVRDVHISHYGRICPIETPEGTNIGLISSLAMYATVDDYGFLVTPYRKVKNGKLTDEVVWLRADEESEAYVASADVPVKNNEIQGDTVVARWRSDFVLVPTEQDPVHRRGAEPDDRRVGRSDSVPRARRREPRADGFQHAAASGAAAVRRAADRRHRPGARRGPPLGHVRAGRPQGNGHLRRRQPHRDRPRRCTTCGSSWASTSGPARTRSRSSRSATRSRRATSSPTAPRPSRATWPWAATCSSRSCRTKVTTSKTRSSSAKSWCTNDTYTSIHIEEFDVEIRETKLGREEFTRDIPNVSEKALRNLDESGIVQIGTFVEPGDILVGKVSPKSKTELTPEEKLLHAIFGRAGEDVKNDSLEVPSGVEGIVIDTQKFSRRMSLRKTNARRSRSR